MSYITDITAILEALPEDATADEVYTATQGYSRRDVAAAMYALAASGGAPFNGGEIANPLIVNDYTTINGSLLVGNEANNGSWFDVAADDVNIVGHANGIQLDCGAGTSISLTTSSGGLVEAGDFSGTRKIGFFGKPPAARPAGVAVTAEAVHAALVTLGLITGP